MGANVVDVYGDTVVAPRATQNIYYIDIDKPLTLCEHIKEIRLLVDKSGPGEIIFYFCCGLQSSVYTFTEGNFKLLSEYIKSLHGVVPKIVYRGYINSIISEVLFDAFGKFDIVGGYNSVYPNDKSNPSQHTVHP